MTPILAVLTLATLANSERNKNSNPRPLIIGHRGASGMYPEHTALAYRYLMTLRHKAKKSCKPYTHQYYIQKG